MEEKKVVKLVSISEYAEHFKISRPVVYKLIEEGKITRYEDSEGNPMLNLEERPVGVQNYGDIRQRKIRK